MKYNTIIIALVSIVLYNCNQEITYKDGIVSEEFLYDTASFPSCHAATIAETPEGLVAAYFGGTRERHPDVCIYVSRKVDGEWTAPAEVANGYESEEVRYPTWNPVLYQIPDGDLMLFYKVGPSPKTWWGVIKRSSDNGKTWGEAERMPDGFLGPIKNKPVLIENGSLICPSSTETNDGKWRVHFEITPDFGKTWEMVGPICDGKRYGVIQPSVLTHKNGDLQMLSRSRNAVLATSWSKDNGNTWSLIKESGLPNNQSGTDAVSLADGRQLVVYNHVKTPMHAKKGYRTPLNVAYSEDGRNWYASLILEDSEISQYSYPAVIQSSDGMVHIIYTWRRQKIKYVMVDPTKLKGKEIIDEKWPGNPNWN